ncbi:MAG TPA: YcaO-related McrA-glycine thioamidation protein [Methanothermobacter sp.]|nr:conserved hypothetical protein [Methanothermobacter sp. MT-2]HHW05399.1 YcaO-related McrA-glycine thioamidation protein [Methanothermobacter sp.]HOK73154.1 YcaO-related McrA-glycine thioamidation protein [Methanothermobacter sp.]HOL68786.1 YcaO-related McrA-glycine thioamidation protein [Methanothermobacter sp.]HPQ04679.1 YcaO-related McrA-glycine thioamidation protein [Methanothermobacter sp.]
MFSDVPVKYIGCTHRARNPSETIRWIQEKLQMIGVTRITEITHLDRIGIPVYSAIRPTAEDGAVSIYAGKGATRSQAKASAMMEAFERYSAEKKSADSKKSVRARVDEIGEHIDLESLILPQGSDVDGEIEWVKAKNLKDEKEVQVPANAVYHPYNPPGECISLFRSNTNGLASGNAIEEAIFHGLMELIERDAWSMFEAKRGPKREINCQDVDNKIIVELLKKFEDAKIDITLIDLTSDIRIPTIAAVADDVLLKDPALLSIGVGTHLDPEVAVIRALTEVAQSRATQIHGTREDTVRAIFMRKAGYKRMKRINRHWFGEPEEIIELDEMKNRSKTTFKDDIDVTLKELKRCGFSDVFMVDLTREVEIPVVRVIVPGLEVFAVDSSRIGDRIKYETGNRLHGSVPTS